jgi:hypothetical protein
MSLATAHPLAVSIFTVRHLIASGTSPVGRRVLVEQSTLEAFIASNWSQSVNRERKRITGYRASDHQHARSVFASFFGFQRFIVRRPAGITGARVARGRGAAKFAQYRG